MTEAENTDNNEAAEEPQRRYNFDSLDEYLAAAEKVGDEGRLDDAIDVLREATEAHPDSAMAHYDLGVAIFLKLKEELAHMVMWEALADEEELAEECLVAFQTAIEKDSEMAPAYANLGAILALRGRYREAVTALEKSLFLDPNQPEVKEELEIVTAKCEQPEEEEE